MGYSINQQKAWDHLTNLEQMALQLTIVAQRSKQEAAIIMNIAPYKFNELLLRARRFFLLFTEYYETYSRLLPENVQLSPEEYSFFTAILLERNRANDVVKDDPQFRNLVRYPSREKLWHTYLTEIQKEGIHGQALFILLKEFDKWNRFRILPKEYQLPSPFSRRRIKQFKKIKDQLNNITDLGWEILLKEYSTTKPPLSFLPTFRMGEPRVEIVKLSRNTLAYFTNNQLPLFSSEPRAKSFIELTHDYNSLRKKSPHSSQKFWASFRLILADAINYNELLNIQPGDLADLSVQDRKFIKQAKKQYKERIASVKPSPTGAFWYN